MLVIVAKTALIALVVRLFGYSARVAITTGISLAQIGEFAFVLLSHASSLGLVQRTWYLLLLGTTAVSIVTTPLLFRITPYVIKLAITMRWMSGDATPVEIEFAKTQGAAMHSPGGRGHGGHVHDRPTGEHGARREEGGKSLHAV